jgi:hypothetical protein
MSKLISSATFWCGIFAVSAGCTYVYNRWEVSNKEKQTENVMMNIRKEHKRQLKGIRNGEIDCTSERDYMMYFKSRILDPYHNSNATYHRENIEEMDRMM